MAVFYYNHEAELYHSAMNPSPDELYHYGVKGMKWGKHKYGADYIAETLRPGISYKGPNAIQQNAKPLSKKKKKVNPKGQYWNPAAREAANKIKEERANTAKESERIIKEQKDSQYDKKMASKKAADETIAEARKERYKSDIQAVHDRNASIRQEDTRKQVEKRKRDISNRVDENIALQRAREKRGMDRMLAEQEKQRRRRQSAKKMKRLTKSLDKNGYRKTGA